MRFFIFLAKELFSWVISGDPALWVSLVCIAVVGAVVSYPLPSLENADILVSLPFSLTVVNILVKSEPAPYIFGVYFCSF